MYKAFLCTNCQAYYYHSDQLGSVRDLTDSSGAVANTYEYDPYRVPSSTGTTGTAYNSFGFSGESKDSETGLIYLRARYYDPSTQQCLTRDPLVGKSQQPYAYAGGSPLNATDPSGQFLDTLFDIGSVIWDIDNIVNGEGLNWWTGGALALDAAALAIPFVPGEAGNVRRLARAADAGGSGGGSIRVFYHGTNTAGADDILAHGIRESVDNPTFARLGLGRGFYTTPDLWAAQHFADIRAARYGGDPVVLKVYVDNVSKLTGALVPGHLYGSNPFPEHLITGFDFLTATIGGLAPAREVKFNPRAFQYLNVGR